MAAIVYAVANLRTLSLRSSRMSDPNPTAPVHLHHKIYGTGNPLLCIHGFGASLFSWRNFVTPLSQNYQLILIDLKGAGNSPKPPDNGYSTQDHANLIYQFILDHDLRNLTLVGNSFGGALCLLLSIILMEKQPGRLRALVLIDSAAYKQYIPWYVKLIGLPLIGAVAIYLTPAWCMARSILKLAYFDPKKITAEQIAAYAAPIASP